MMRCVAFLAGLVGLTSVLAAPAKAHSPEYTQYTSPESVQNWHLTLGAGLRYQPDYVGSNDYIFRPRGIISLGRGTRSTWWSAEDDAISIGFFSGKAWRVGFSGNLLWERKASTNAALRITGVHSVGAIAQATYAWSDKLQTTAYVEYKHLMGDAAKAPIVKTYGARDSITVGISATYAFDLGFK